MPSALILIADGTEEMELSTITYDTLVRAGVKTNSAYVSNSDSRPNPPVVKCSRGLKVVSDAYFNPEKCGPNAFDALVIPGGAQGAEIISTNLAVQQLVQSYINAEKIVAMICAGSLTALTSKLDRQRLTSHPSVKAQLEKAFDYEEEPVVVSNNLVTSRGPGTAFPFALTLVELLCGKEKRLDVQAPMIFPPGTPW